MKSLHDCKEYFKDVYKDAYCVYKDEKSEARYKMFFDLMQFIYGDEFKKVNAAWSQEASDEYYSKL